MTTKREDIYDTQIGPLMTQIIAIAQAHDIPMLATFELDDDRASKERTGLKCTTAVLLPGTSRDVQQAAQMITEGFVAFAMTVRGG